MTPQVTETELRAFHHAVRLCGKLPPGGGSGVVLLLMRVLSRKRDMMRSCPSVICGER